MSNLSNNYTKGIITICETEKADSPIIEYDNIKNLTIHESENYGQTGTVQLINDYSESETNLLSDNCALWANIEIRQRIDRGMFLKVYQNERKEENQIGIFLITQIDASEAILTLTFCDSVQYLRSIGADYVRNFYGGDMRWEGVKTVWVNNEAHTPHKQGVVLHGGAYKDIIIDKDTTVIHNRGDQPINWHDSITAFLPTPHFKRIRHIKIVHIYNLAYEAHFSLDIKITTDSGTEVFNGRLTTFIGMEAEGEYNIEFNPPFEAEGNGLIIETNNPSDTTGQTKYDEGIEGAWLQWHGGGRKEGAYYNTELYLIDDTSDVEGTNYDNYFRIKTIDGTAVTEDMIKSIDWDPNTQIFYTDPSAWIYSGEIFRQILDAYNFKSEVLPDSRQVSVFRCNCDTIHNYLLALADMENNGHQYGFRSNAIDWDIIDIGKRSKKSDESVLDIFYAKDIINKRDAFISFNPSISLKNNPRLSVSKGAAENGNPIMVAVVDPKQRTGACNQTIGNSTPDILESAMSAYSDIMKNRSTDWAGEIVLSGIRKELMTSGEFCGGKPIRITDSRYGFYAYEAKVKEIEYDYANQKTTITVNNYSEVYSNSILNTEKMAYSAGDLSVEGASVDMFLRQFVNLDFSDIYEPQDHSTMGIMGDEGTSPGSCQPSRIEFPELGIIILNGYFAAGNGVCTKQYGIKRIRVGNMDFEIPTARQPDKWSNQSLIVNVIFKQQ